MPPKGDKVSKKTEQKRAEKVIEDKTFGLKNKNKSKVVQSYVKSVTAQVKGIVGKGGEAKQLAEEFAQKAAKKKEEEQKAFLATLFKTVKKTQEEVYEEEPEESLEDNYKEIDLYTDQRDQIFGDKGDNVDEELANWAANKTEKICRFFLDAVEAGKYGWRWKCPNGMGCIYKHALPAGYTLKRDVPLEERKDENTLEERLEVERAQITTGVPVTLERFLKWKEDKKLAREKEIEKKRQEEAKKSGGKGLNVLSGRALFTYDPTLFQDDAEAIGNDEYEEEEEKEEEKEDNGVPEEDEENEDDEEEEEEPEGKEWGENGQVITPTVNATTEGGEQNAEVKKKKKKKSKKKQTTKEDENVQINEDVFLGEDDVELPEDDS